MASVSNTKGTNQKSNSRTEYPWEFVSGLNQTLGRPFSVQELIGALPTTSSIFGGGPIGLQPGGNALGIGGTGGGGTAQQQAGGTLTPRQLMAADIQGPHAGDIRNKANAKIQDAVASGALTLDQPMTQQQIVQFFGGQGGIDDVSRLTAAVSTGAQQRQDLINQTAGTGQPNRINQQGGMTPPIDFAAGARNLGFGQAAPVASQFQFRDVNQINAPDVQAAQGSIAPGGFDRYEQALFESQFRPQEREMARQGEIADSRLQAELAQSGLASSGSGIGQIQDQRRELSARIDAQAADAARNATVQRYGTEYAQLQENLNRQQQANLTKAGFQFEAQSQNAANILRGNEAESANYLATLGLNNQVAQAARADFLSFMGVTQQEFERVSNFQQNLLSTVFNGYLQQAGLLADAGKVQEGKSSGGGGSRVGVLA